jgi:hypothetical protein
MDNFLVLDTSLILNRQVPSPSEGEGQGEGEILPCYDYY